MASTIITLPDGSKGAVDPALFVADPGNTLGSLRYPYATFALIFVAAAGVWTLQRVTSTIGNGGVGDTDLQTGFSGTLGNNETSLLKNGFFTSKASYTVKGHAVAPTSAPYSAAVTGAGDSSAVAFTGATRNDCIGIAGQLVQAALQSTYVELYQQSRKCFSLLGLAASQPAGFGLASQTDLTNGMLGCGTQSQYRRPTVIPPGNTNTPEYLWRFTYGTSALSVTADPSFAAPANGQVCVIKAVVYFDGYFSDENGLPLVMDAQGSQDYYEAAIANDHKVGYC